MSLTQIKPEVIDIPEASIALIEDPVIGGIRDYIDSTTGVAITQPPGTSDNRIATTAFVQTAVANSVRVKNTTSISSATSIITATAFG